MIQIDMSIPKSCLDCKITYYAVNEGDTTGIYRCCLTGEDVDNITSCRSDNCHLKEIPSGKWEQINKNETNVIPLCNTAMEVFRVRNRI